MPDWRAYVRARLPLPDLEPGRAEEAVEDIAAQLEDVYLEAIGEGATEAEAQRRVEEQIQDWRALAGRIQTERGHSRAVRADRGVEAVETYLRDRGTRWGGAADALRNVRLSARRMRRTPGFSAVVLITLAIGIGANTSIFSVINGVLLKPLPFYDADRLVSVWTSAPGIGEERMPQSPVVNLVYDEQSELHEGIGLWAESEVTVREIQGPSRVPATFVTSGVLRALAVDPIRGRRFTPEEDWEGAPQTAMLSHAYWQSRYGGQAVVGERITVDGVEREIVGVFPASLGLFASDPAIYLPLAFDRSQLFVGNFSYRSLARLKGGVSIEQAETEFSRLLRVAVRTFPGAMSAEQVEQIGVTASLRPLKEDVVGDIGDVLWLLLGGVGIILIVACANVANLFLVRAETREREFAVRAALGAGRGRISVDLLIESLLLGLAGGVVGTGFAYVGLRSLVSLAPEDLPRLGEISLDPIVLVFTVLVSLAAGVFFGLFPVLRYRRMNAVAALKEGGRGAGAGKERHRTRNALVVAQMAMALVLLIGSGLMIRSFQSLLRVHPGFEAPERLLAFGIALPEAEIPETEQVALTHERLARRLEELPSVISAGMTSSVPMDGRGSFDPLWIEDFPVPDGQLPNTRRFKWVSPGYFETMGIPIVAGRAYTWSDIRNRSRYTVVNERIAREFWDDPAEAIGKRISTGSEPTNWREIIGVVGNVRDDGLSQDLVPIVYWPMVVESLWGTLPDDLLPELNLLVPRRLQYVVRTDADAVGMVASLREAVWSVDPNLPLANARSFDIDVRASMSRTSFTLVMLAIAATMALILGAVGVYGVISYVVSQRTREIGVRVVLGAESGAVQRMVLGQGLRLALAGIVIGLLSGVAMTRAMAGLLHGVSPLDPLTFGSVALVLTAIALLASYLPARRAAGVDPIEAIRAE
ncbi:MAG: ABC transporter permease [Gemmatimonadetes bacterium]|nr:ABC transporter permease [Gemmatimonadota bacterium]